MTKINLVASYGVLNCAEEAILTFWHVATSESLEVARWTSPVYKSAERFLITALTAATGSHAHALRVRDRLAANGPDFLPQRARYSDDESNLASLVDSCNSYPKRG